MIRRARKEEAAQIAEMFMLAWPIEEILESNGLTYEEVIERDGKVFRRFSPISAEEAEKIINNL